MKPTFVLLFLAATLPLGGCAAGLAASAVGAAVGAASPSRTITHDLRDDAVRACTARAEQDGEARIIDAELRQSGRVIVWGTVQDATQHRRSFECRYDGEVKAFRLREIGAR